MSSSPGAHYCCPEADCGAEHKGDTERKRPAARNERARRRSRARAPVAPRARNAPRTPAGRSRRAASPRAEQRARPPRAPSSTALRAGTASANELDDSDQSAREHGDRIAARPVPHARRRRDTGSASVSSPADRCLPTRRARVAAGKRERPGRGNHGCTESWPRAEEEKRGEMCRRHGEREHVHPPSRRERHSPGSPPRVERSSQARTNA